MKNTKPILLNWLPPSLESSPSPSLSVLKSYIHNEGYTVQIKYWNLKIKKILEDFFNFGDKIYENDIFKLLPFFSYIAIKHKDIKLLNTIKYFVLDQKPQLQSKGKDFINKYLFDYYLKIDKFIEDELNEMGINEFNIIGFSAQFYQWIVANIIIEKIKEMNSDIVVIIGGLGTEEQALGLMNNFKHYDYAIWGEGEFPLVKIIDNILNNRNQHSYNDFHNIVYKYDGQLVIAKGGNKFSKMDDCLFDYSDYFNEIKTLNLNMEINLPIEGGRGCHWKKCNFCFLNSGYKFRVKSPEKIIAEIKDLVIKYDITNISFLDNDIIGNDLNRFNHLLDLLIEFRSENNTFKVVLAEIITRNINYETIKKMSLAGFKGIQIGYESPSNNLLLKINKKNTFASNLFFIKWGTYFGFNITGVNVLRNLPEETPSDVKESICNLYFMRFILTQKSIKHNMSFLSISKASPYYHSLQKKGLLYKYQSDILKFLPENYVSELDRFNLFFDFAKLNYNPLWNTFVKMESHYFNNEYDYLLIFEKGIVYYREYYNRVEVKELEFDIKSNYWKILELCNKNILSLEQLELQLNFDDINLDEKQLINVVNDLKEEGLVYCNESLSEIVSVVNTNLVNTN